MKPQFLATCQNYQVSLAHDVSISKRMSAVVELPAESRHAFLPRVRRGETGLRARIALLAPMNTVFYRREDPARGCRSLAMMPVQPVWWDAPTPLPVSPSKYSWNRM